MPQVDATVYWDAATNGPKVTPDPISVASGNGATVIQWTATSDITNFTITNLDQGEFTLPANQQPGKFTATDKNDQTGTYTYNVSATHTSGHTATHDPRIENGSEPRES
jgi:hypothetical protein